MSWFGRRRCRRVGHDWLLGYSSVYVSGQKTSEFIPTTDICLRCGEKSVTLPYGQCMGQHPLAEHYDADGKIVAHPSCPGPW